MPDLCPPFRRRKAARRPQNWPSVRANQCGPAVLAWSDPGSQVPLLGGKEFVARVLADAHGPAPTATAQGRRADGLHDTIAERCAAAQVAVAEVVGASKRPQPRERSAGDLRARSPRARAAGRSGRDGAAHLGAHRVARARSPTATCPRPPLTAGEVSELAHRPLPHNKGTANTLWAAETSTATA